VRRFSKLSQNIWYFGFHTAVFVKGLDGILEIVGGVFFLCINQSSLNHIVRVLTQHELADHAKDSIANALGRMLINLSLGTKIFVGMYLLIHGAIKVLIVAGLLLNKRWSYPISIAFLIVFIAYQVYRLSVHYSIVLLILTLYDCLLVVFIWHEYRHRAIELSSKDTSTSV
jgi:uncharacterized membrane protein